MNIHFLYEHKTRKYSVLINGNKIFCHKAKWQKMFKLAYDIFSNVQNFSYSFEAKSEISNCDHVWQGM